jgi:TRAP transporter TAXI family solute receptor
MTEGRTRLLVILVLWVATLSAALVWFLSTRTEQLAIAAGPRSSESFWLASAIATVFEDSMPGIRVDVFETSGSSENAKLLESGQVDFALVQGDTRVGEAISAVASLFFDAYQLVVAETSDIRSFSDLAGRRVAIAPKGSGENLSFWFVAEHYGLDADQLTALPMSEDAANFAMVMGQVDAVFRVRAPGNPSVRDLVRNHPMRLVAIHQSEALSLKQPAITPGVVPVGSYRGAPPLPDRDLPTAVVERLLVAHAELELEVVQQLTRTLFERHSDLVARSSLAGFIRAIDGDSNIAMPLHPGARRYYDREKPTFWQQNTRVLASLLYVVAIIVSAGLALRSHFMRARKVRIGDYNMQLMDIAEQARDLRSPQALYDLKDRLMNMLQQVVRDLDKDRVTQEEFEHFSFTWQAVDTVVRDRMLMANHPMAPHYSREHQG